MSAVGVGVRECMVPITAGAQFVWKQPKITLQQVSKRLASGGAGGATTTVGGQPVRPWLQAQRGEGWGLRSALAGSAAVSSHWQLVVPAGLGGYPLLQYHAM